MPKGSLGITYGIFWSALGVVAIPMPYIGGLLYDNVGPQVPFWVAVAVIAATVPLALWKLRAPAPAAESAEPALQIEPISD